MDRQCQHLPEVVQQGLLFTPTCRLRQTPQDLLSPRGLRDANCRVDLCSQESLPPKSGIAGPGPALSNESHTRLRLEEVQLLGPRTSEDTGIGTPVPETPDCGLPETEIPSMEGPRDRLRVGPHLNMLQD